VDGLRATRSSARSLLVELAPEPCDDLLARGPGLPRLGFVGEAPFDLRLPLGREWLIVLLAGDVLVGNGFEKLVRELRPSGAGSSSARLRSSFASRVIPLQ
jgi:hypothetical protein